MARSVTSGTVKTGPGALLEDLLDGHRFTRLHDLADTTATLFMGDEIYINL